MSKRKGGTASLSFWRSAEPKNADKRFTVLGSSLFTCEPMKSLNPVERWSYLCMVDAARGNAEFFFPASVAKSYGISDTTLTRCVKVLCKKGFVEKTQSGKNLRKPNEYRFVSAWKEASK